MEDFAFYLMDYIKGNALVAIPLLLIMGSFMKVSRRCPDWCIPGLLMPIGITLCIMLLGFSVKSFMQGILLTCAVVYGHQLWNRIDFSLAPHTLLTRFPARQCRSWKL